MRPRIDERRLRVVVEGGEHPDTEAALSMQEESVVREDAVATAYLVAGAEPDPDWSRLLLDAHAEGYAAVGGAVAVEGGSGAASAAPSWPPGRPEVGATRASRQPLAPPSLLEGLEPTTHLGLPAYSGADAPLRGPGGRQTSTAIRSSERLKTHAPSASAAAGRDDRVDAVGERRRLSPKNSTARIASIGGVRKFTQWSAKSATGYSSTPGSWSRL